jgi:Zn-dependent protease
VIPVAATSRCECGADVAAGLLACPGCGRLAHRDDLTRLATEAESAEAAGDLTAALTAWRKALQLLPPGTVQERTIRARMQGLGATIDGRPAPAGATRGRGGNRKAGAAAGVGTAALVLLKLKGALLALLANGKLLVLGLLKLPTLLSMLVYMRWTGASGTGFALGIVISIYVHEMGHVAALRRYGIEASAPMFVPGFGALVRLRQYPTDAHEDARTGLAGPLWGLGAAVTALVLGLATAFPLARGVAALGAVINLFNLIPVWQLDGSRGLRALARSERFALAAIALATGAALHEWMPAIVGAVTLARAAGKDAPAKGDRRVFLLYAFLVVAHGLVAGSPQNPS